MFTRQPCFKALRNIPHHRWRAGLGKYHFQSHAHQLLDKNPQPDSIAIHRSMLDCLRKDRPFQALETFKGQLLLLGSASTLDEVTVAIALKACRGDPSLGSQIHGFAITSGFISYVSVANSLMNMYCKGGNFSRALCVFESLSEPDIVSWNTVLSGFERNGDALGFACRMNSSGVAFDAVTYSTVLALCSRHEEFLGLQFHSCVVKVGLECEVYVGNALISLYSGWGRLAEARTVFEDLPQRDLVSWNAIISGYTQEGTYGLEAILMFIEMVRRGIVLDHVSLTSAVSACGHERNVELGRQMHGLCIKRGYGKQVSVGNVLMSTYTKCEVIKDAKLVFQKMDDRNVISWTTIISVSQGDAVSLFNQMRLEDVYPNDVTFIGLIHALTVGGFMEQGKMVHGICIKTGFLSESNVCNSLITMYAIFKSPESSMKVFEGLTYREIITWNALISGFVQNGLFQEAIEAFFSTIMESKPNDYTFASVLNAIATAEDVSLKHGQRCHSQIIKLGLNAEPIVSGALLDMYAKRGSICDSQKVFSETPHRSQFAWTAIISAYARYGDYGSVMNWFEEMERDRVRPDSVTFLSVLTACGRKGMVDVGRCLFDSMAKHYQIEPSPEHYSCMVDMLGRAGKLEEAEHLISRVPGGPRLSMLQSLLGACRIHGNVDMGERVADSLMEMEPTESGTYVQMSNLYAEKGQWEKAARVRKMMRQKRVKKDVGLSWVDAGEPDTYFPLHGFSSGDKSHPESKEIYRMAEFLGFEMKSVRENKQKQHSFM